MFTLNCKGRIISIDQPVVMGIINATPDSFYKGSRINDKDAQLKKAEKMCTEGALILDIGGQSTRPGSKIISAEEELKRVIPVIDLIHRNFPEQLLSVDTFYSTVAKEAVDAGASIINDVSAGTIDDLMLPAVATMRVPYILTHMRGLPEHMQKDPVYENVVLEVFDFLNLKLKLATDLGIHNIIVDMGFGFGKTIAHNFQLLKNLSFFKHLNRPLLAGLSRKGTIYKTLGITTEEALNGTTVLNTIALMNGADILRVHDVKEACEAIRLFNECYK